MTAREILCIVNHRRLLCATQSHVREISLSTGSMVSESALKPFSSVGRTALKKIGSLHGIPTGPVLPRLGQKSSSSNYERYSFVNLHLTPQTNEWSRATTGPCLYGGDILETTLNNYLLPKPF